MTTTRPALQPPTFAPTYTRWQYNTIFYLTGRDYEKNAEQQLNAAGADGWEVCGFVRGETGRIDNYRIIVKRAY